MSQNKHKTVLNIRQHTPLIHFQSDQRGATLRATELKPKLDRFLIEQVFCNDEEKYGKFLIQGKESSLDYKVAIQQDLSSSTEIPERGSLFFGNMKPKSTSEEEWRTLKKRFKQHKENFKITIFSFKRGLVDVIESNFEKFLAQTNFGTRQSKGFGSFYLANRPFNPELIPFEVYAFSTKNWENDIKLFYQFVRQGINLPRGANSFYAKPAIFSYAKSKGWTWDKRAIKQKYFNDKLQDQIADHDNADVLSYVSDEAYLLRDVFGLSSSQEWMSYGVSIEKSGIRTEEVNRKKEVAVQRFKSPVTFKVVDDTVYFWANDTFSLVAGENFLVQTKRGKSVEGDMELSYPEAFDFNDFFDFVLGIDLSKHIASKYHEISEYRTLERILKSIKEQK